MSASTCSARSRTRMARTLRLGTRAFLGWMRSIQTQAIPLRLPLLFTENAMRSSSMVVSGSESAMRWTSFRSAIDVPPDRRCVSRTAQRRWHNDVTGIIAPCDLSQHPHSRKPARRNVDSFAPKRGQEHLPKRTLRVYDRPLTIEQNLTMLAATPACIADLTEGLSPALLLTPPEPDFLVGTRCACPSARLRRHVGQIYRDDPQRGSADVSSRRSYDLDQADRLLRVGISPLAAGVYGPARRTVGSVAATRTGSLVTDGAGDRGRQAAGTNRADVCPVAGKP